MRIPLVSVLSASLVASATTVPTQASARTPVSALALVGVEEPAAVLGLDGSDEAAAKNLTDELRRAFGRRGLGGSEELSLAEVRLTMGCEGDDPACLSEAGKSIGVENLIFGTLEPSGKEYKLTLNILNVPGAVTETTTTRPVTKEQLAPGNIEQTANEIVESLFPKEDESVDAPPPPVLEEDPQPYTEPRDEPSKSGLIWGPYKPRPKWKWAGFGVGIGLTVIGVAGAATTGVMLNNSLRDDVFQAAEDSLTDCQVDGVKVPCESPGDTPFPDNDVDPNMEGDLCAAGRATEDANGDPYPGGAVRNAAVADACTRADVAQDLNVASFAVLGVGAAVTLVFTTLLFVHKENPSTKAMRRRDIQVGASPVRGGGMTFSGGFRF